MGLRRAYRVIAAAAVVSATAVGLTACQSKVGQAASIDGHQLSESTLDGYVTASAAVTTDSQGNAVVPKVSALQLWLFDELLQQAVDLHGSRPTDTEISQATSALFTASNTTRAGVYASELKQGYTTSLAELAIHEEAVLLVLVHRLSPSLGYAQAFQALQGGQATSAIDSDLSKLHPHVSVAGRYGAWNAQTLSLDSDKRAGLPSFIGGAAVSLTPTGQTAQPGQSG